MFPVPGLNPCIKAAVNRVIDNGGDLAQLDAEVERCWTWLEGLEQPAAP